jgi:protein O-GlcNAc transferase
VQRIQWLTGMADLARALELWSDGRHPEAEREIVALLRVSPEDPAPLRFLAEIYGATGRRRQSIALWRKLSELAPTDPALVRQLAQVLLAEGALVEAIAQLRVAISLEPRNARAYNNLGLAQLRGGDAEGAAASLEHAVRIDSRYALAHMNLGLAREQANQPALARTSYERALQIDPHLTQARARLSELLRISDESAARRERDRALESHAINLMTVRRHDDAIPVWTQLIDAGSQLDYLIGTRFHCQLHCCDWSHYAETATQLEAEVLRGRRVDLPFSFFVHSNSAAAQLECSRVLIADRYPAVPAGPDSTPSQRQTSARIRVAYLSADFHEHATAYLIAGLLEHHDRVRFEIIALSYGLNDGSAMRTRIEKAVDRFVDVSQRTDGEVVELLRGWGVHIAIDLKGFTGGGRIGIFARRAAPVQINSLGYPGTLGADYMDYIIADRHVIPEPDRIHYGEQVIYMPRCYQPNDPARPLPVQAPARAEWGLPERGFVFCCFNNLYKITPAMFALWLDLLHRVPGSVLWLLEGTPTAMRNLRSAAEAAGIAPQRVVFAPHIPLARHLARYRRADLFLDTAPCNAHTTASDALWMGVPVLTLTGSTFAGRVATSLLHAVDLPQLCTKSAGEYAAVGFRLATSPEKLAALKAHLEAGRATFPLFDAATYCRHIESAYEEVLARHVRRERPSALEMAPR